MTPNEFRETLAGVVERRETFDKLLAHYNDMQEKATRRIHMADDITDTKTGLVWHVQRITLNDGTTKIGHVQRRSESSSEFEWLINAGELFPHAQKGYGTFAQCLDHLADLGQVVNNTTKAVTRLRSEARHLQDKWKKDHPEQPPGDDGGDDYVLPGHGE